MPIVGAISDKYGRMKPEPTTQGGWGGVYYVPCTEEEENTCPCFGRERSEPRAPRLTGLSGKKALLGACVVLNVGQLGCAFAPNEWVYIVFRHITGAGTGCCSLTS